MQHGTRKQMGWVFFLVLMMATGVWLGCSGGGGSGSGGNGNTNTSTTVIRGTLGTSFRTTQNQTTANGPISPMAGDYTVDEIWGLPVGDSVDVYCLNDKQVFIVNEDGSFELTLPAESEEKYIFMLMDLDATEKIDRFIGYIALADVQENLILIPADEASEDIDLGELELDGEEAEADTSLEDASDSFSLTLEQLTEMARMDDLYKMVKNIYVNYDAATDTHYRIQMNFQWDDVLDNIDNQFANPVDYGYSYYRPNVFTNDTIHIDMQGLADGQWLAAFYPPVDLLYEPPDGYRGPSNPITSDNVTEMTEYPSCDIALEDEDFFVCSSGSSHQFGLPVGGFMESTVAQGYWYFEREQSTDPLLDVRLATFDLAPATPFDADGNPKIYVPAPHIVTGNNRRVERIEIRWYLFDADLDEYVQVTDLTALQETVRLSRAALIDYNNGVGESGVHTSEGLYITDPTLLTNFDQPWYLSGAVINSDDALMQSFSISFEIGGVSMSFGWMYSGHS